jgi:hypothetical protein
MTWRQSPGSLATQSISGVSGRIDRVFDEPDRSVAEREVAAAGMLARGGVKEVGLTGTILGCDPAAKD